MNVEMRVHILRTFIAHPLVHIHQKKKIALEIAAKLASKCKRALTTASPSSFCWAKTRTLRQYEELSDHNFSLVSCQKSTFSWTVPKTAGLLQILWFPSVVTLDQPGMVLDLYRGHFRTELSSINKVSLACLSCSLTNWLLFFLSPDGIVTITTFEKDTFDEVKERLWNLLTSQIINFRYMNFEYAFQEDQTSDVISSYFMVSRYSFPFGRPEGALKATLSLFERVTSLRIYFLIQTTFVIPRRSIKMAVWHIKEYLNHIKMVCS